MTDSLFSLSKKSLHTKKPRAVARAGFLRTENSFELSETKSQNYCDLIVFGLSTSRRYPFNQSDVESVCAESDSSDHRTTPDCPANALGVAYVLSVSIVTANASSSALPVAAAVAKNNAYVLDSPALKRSLSSVTVNVPAELLTDPREVVSDVPSDLTKRTSIVPLNVVLANPCGTTVNVNCRTSAACAESAETVNRYISFTDVDAPVNG